ncbi:MAG: outer membrane protein assembly factor BamD [Saprospiraceae bacterium]|nr:outer membrane protein assembly factor BamD [Saprospiraceae bacterium]
MNSFKKHINNRTFAAMLKQKGFFISNLLIIIVLLFSGCKSKFETLRLSSDKDLKLSKAFEFYEQKEYLKAQYLFEDLIGQVRMTSDAEKVYFYYAYTHYHLKNYSFASYYFKKFSTTYPTGKYAEEALFKSADSFYKLSPNYRLTQEDTESAIEGLQIFINTYPHSEKVAECNERIDKLRAKLEQKAFDNAKGYYHRKRYKSSAYTFNNLLVNYPDTKEGEYIRYMIIKSTFKYAQQSILSKQIERLEQTAIACNNFKKKHNDSKHIKEVEQIYITANNKIKKIRNEY